MLEFKDREKVKTGMNEYVKCKVIIPELGTNNIFAGNFFVMDDIITIWIDYSKTMKEKDRLLKLLSGNNPFTMNLIDSSECWYTCFSCFSLTANEQLERHAFDCIKIFCNSWIEKVNLKSLSDKFAKSVKITYPYTEPLFRGCNKEYLYVINKNISIQFKQVELQYLDFKNRITSNDCSFYLHFKEKSDLTLISRIEKIIWLFIRFTSNIQIPRGVIKIIDDKTLNECQVHYRYEGRTIKEYANFKEYCNEPIKLYNILLDKQIIKNWFDFCKQYYHVMTMFSRCMDKTTLIDERIAHYIQIFDSLTNKRNNKEHLQQRLSKAIRALSHVNLDKYNSEVLKACRVAFSHLEKKSFDIIDKELTLSNVKGYECLAENLVRIEILKKINYKDIDSYRNSLVIC